MEKMLVVMVVGGLLLNFGFLALIAVLAHQAEEERRRVLEQLQSLAVLGRAETLEQFAAIERKLQKDRLEAAREEGPHAQFEGERLPVAGKPRRVLESLWRRAPKAPAQQDTTVKE